MNCNRVKNLLSAYIDSELPGVEMLEIRSHVVACPDCQMELVQIRNIKLGLSRLKVYEPENDLAKSLILNATSTPIESHFSNRQIGALIATAAAAALIAAFAFNLTARSNERTKLANEQPRFDSGTDRAVTMPDIGGHAPIIPVSK